jgi:hypothetical protein
VTSLADLCLDLFLLGHAHLAAGLAGDGFAFERRVRNYLSVSGLPDARGFRFLGRRSLSGLYHQLDEQTACDEAVVIGEWKAWSGRIPKNDLLRFKAATDDYWFSTSGRLTLPVVRMFGGTGQVSEAMRAYAAHWGIVLITPDRWPVPALSDPDLLWGAGDLDAPGLVDRIALASLVRPVGSIIKPEPDGTWRVAAMARDADLANRMAVWRYWSSRAWAWWDDVSPARFNALLDGRTSRVTVLTA